MDRWLANACAAATVWLERTIYFFRGLSEPDLTKERGEERDKSRDPRSLFQISVSPNSFSKAARGGAVFVAAKSYNFLLRGRLQLYVVLSYQMIGITITVGYCIK